MKKKWDIVFLIYADFIDENKGNPKLDEKLLLELNSLLGDLVETPVDETKFNAYVILSSVNYAVKKEGEQLELRNLTFIFRIEPGGKSNKITCIDSVDKVRLTEEDKK